MFVLKSKMKDKLKRQYEKGYNRGLSESEEERKAIIKEKNSTIKKLLKERDNYIERSYKLDDTIYQAERLKRNLLDVLSKLVTECDDIIHKKRMNDNFILKKEHKFERVS